MPESHYPECPAPSEYGGGEYYIYDERPCICDRLRACEQRVLLSKPNIELSAVYGYEAGRSDGLNAARDAVAALPDFSTFAEGLIYRDDALAAIDALRGESNG